MVQQIDVQQIYTTVRGKGPGTCYNAAHTSNNFTITQLAADWHELTALQCTQCIISLYTTVTKLSSSTAIGITITTTGRSQTRPLPIPQRVGDWVGVSKQWVRLATCWRLVADDTTTAELKSFIHDSTKGPLRFTYLHKQELSKPKLATPLHACVLVTYLLVI